MAANPKNAGSLPQWQLTQPADRHIGRRQMPLEVPQPPTHAGWSRRMSRLPSGQRSDKTNNDRYGPLSALPVGRLGESEPPAGGMPTKLAGHAISYGAFIATGQDVAALATAEEADRAALAALGELVGCVSWTAAQNLSGCLTRPLRRRISLRSFDSSMCRFVGSEPVRDVRDIEAARLVPSIIGRGCSDFLSNHAALSWWKSGLALQTRFGRPGLRRGAIPLGGSEVGL